MYQFQQKLKILKTSIKKWNKETFGNIFQAKKEIDCKIKEVQNQGMQFGFLPEIIEKERMLIKNSASRNIKRSYTGVRKPELNGFRKENETLFSFTNQLYIIGKATN